MERDDNMEINENFESFNDSSVKTENYKDGPRKSFIPHKKRVILQELEPISESNILEDCSKYLSKGSTSFTYYTKPRKNQGRMSQSIGQQNMNRSMDLSNTESTESDVIQPATPPAILRKRIKEAQEMKDYLEKELTELQDFTTNEKQILAVEEGLLQLQKQNIQLADQNSSLKLEMEEMKMFIESQKTVLLDLNTSLDETKDKLENSIIEKDLMIKELEDMKRKYVDEQMEKQILETKWKQREDDLKKSLEEAWNTLRIKEEHITKMNSKIFFLHSKSEKVKSLDLTFGDQCLPAASEHNEQTINQNIIELLELSSSNFPEDEKLSHFGNKNCNSGDCIENSETYNFNALQNELEEYRNGLELHKKQLEGLNKNLADKDLLISCYEKNLFELEQNLSDYLSCETVFVDNKCCCEAHETVFEKIKCDVKLALSLGEYINKENSSNDQNEAKCKGDSITNSVRFHDVPKTDFQINQNEPKIEDTNVLFKTNSKSTETNLNVIGKLCAVNAHTQTDINYITVMNTEGSLIPPENEASGNTSWQNSQETVISLGSKFIELEGTIKNSEQNLGMLENKLSSNEPTIFPIVDVHSKTNNDSHIMRSHQEKFISLENELSDSMEIIPSSEEKIVSLKNYIPHYEQDVENKYKLVLENKLLDYEKIIENNRKEINMLKIKILDYERMIEDKANRQVASQSKIQDSEEIIDINQEKIDTSENNEVFCEVNISTKSDFLNRSSQTDIDSKVIYNLYKLNYMESNITSSDQGIEDSKKRIAVLENKVIEDPVTVKHQTEEMNVLQNKISYYQEIIKKNEEEINVLQNKLSDYEESIKSNLEIIGILQNKISHHEETLIHNVDEMNTSKNKVTDQNNVSMKLLVAEGSLPKAIDAHSDLILCNHEEIMLQNKIDDSEANIKINQEEWDKIQNVRNNKNEVNIMQNQVLNCEQTILKKNSFVESSSQTVTDSDLMRCNEEKLIILENQISNSEEKVIVLQNKIIEYEDTIKNSKEEISVLQSKICNYEFEISVKTPVVDLSVQTIFDSDVMRSNEEKIIFLENKVSDSEQRQKATEKEVMVLQNEVMKYRETIEKNKEFDCKNTIINNKDTFNEEKLLFLQNKVSDYELIIKVSEEKVILLQNKIIEYEERIKNKTEEISRLENTVSGFGVIVSKKLSAFERDSQTDIDSNFISSHENKIKILSDEITEYEAKIKFNLEELCLMESKISDFEQTIMSKDQDINLLQNKVLNYEHTINIDKAEIMSLENKVFDYEHKLAKRLSVTHASLQTDINSDIMRSNEEKFIDLENKILDNEQRFKDDEEKVIALQNQVIEYEKNMVCSREEMDMLQNKVLGYEEAITNNEEEIKILKNLVSGYEKTLGNNKENITSLKGQVIAFEQIIQTSEEKIKELQNKISDYELTIKNNAEQIIIFQNKISCNEEAINNSSGEVNILKDCISDQEKTIDNNREKIISLENEVIILKKKIKNDGEELNILQIKISDYEYNISAKTPVVDVSLQTVLDLDLMRYGEEKIFSLENIVQGNNQRLESNEETVIKNKIMENDETIHVTDEITLLKKKVSDYELTVKNSVEKIILLENKVVLYEQTIHNNEEEIFMLGNKLSDYDLAVSAKLLVNSQVSQTDIDINIIKLNEEKLRSLENKILDYEQVFMDNKEKFISYESKLSDCYNQIAIYSEEQQQLENKIDYYEQINIDNEKKIALLENKVSEYEKTIKKFEEKHILLPTKRFDYEETQENDHDMSSSELEQTILHNEGIECLQESKVVLCGNTIFDCDNVSSNMFCDESKNISMVAYENFNQTESDLLISVNSYSQNGFVDVECIDILASDTTINVTTLDSTAQLEHSVLISKLPQNDYSVREYDPLASVMESSFTNEDFTLTEQISEQYIIENPNTLQDKNFMNSKYLSLNNNCKIIALINFLNNENELLSVTFDDISKQFSEVKGILNPKGDYVLYSFCQIIENLVIREVANKESWNEKMLLVNNTLSTLKNIRANIMELKSSFFSLETITFQDFDVISSHLKNLFLYNRELLEENELLKEQLKVSLYSEEKLSTANEILKNDLNNVLLLEKKLETLKDYNKNLKDELLEKCIKENDINLLIDEIGRLLNPNIIWSDNSFTSKLKQISGLVMESAGHDHEEVQRLGFLPHFKNLKVQNNSLKDKINFSFPYINIIKSDLESLNADITELFKNLNSDFCSVFTRLSDLYNRQEQESSNNNELKENIKNLVFENTNLKEELINLKTLNEDLKTTSKDYNVLLVKFESLNEVIQANDILLSEKRKFQEHVCLFIDSLKDLYFMEEFQKFDRSCKFSDDLDYISFLQWLEKFLKEVHNVHKSVVENIQSSHQYSLHEGVEELCKEKKKCFDAYNSLNSEFHFVKEALNVYSENIRSIKDSLVNISSEVISLKHSFINDLHFISKQFENLLSVYHENEIDNQKNISNLQTLYDLLNVKYSELAVSKEEMETELQQNKTTIRGYIHEKDELEKKTSDLEIKITELKDEISKFEVEVSDYKSLCHNLERKILDVEGEKGKVENNLKQFGSLAEYNNLKSDQIKLNKILSSLKILYSCVKESFEDIIPRDSDNFEDNLLVIKTAFHALLEERNKCNKIESQYVNAVSERNELETEIELLNSVIKENIQNHKEMSDEIQLLKQKVDINKNDEKTVDLYSRKVMELLVLLNYQGNSKIDDTAWTFIKETIAHYKLIFDKNNGNDVKKLEEKIIFLESQLYDAHDFKTKFSKELHLLKPDLDISYLMTLSLVELQKTMILAIIEKEKDVIADYEMKLASNTDRIQQLEEQDKRRIQWVKEMEKENDRLINECKRIQDNNDSLKADLKSKIQKITDLEDQIKQHVSVMQMNEDIREKEESKNQLAIAVNEKQTLQLTLASLNEKLREKSKECEEMYDSLEKKAKVIFDLEKILSQCKTENSLLEKEVQSLRESMQFNLNNFNDNKTSLEKDLVKYKLQIEKLNMLLDNQEKMYLKENLTVQKEIETETKSVFTDFNDDLGIELKIEGSLNNHLIKMESLNYKIDELNSQLKQQCHKFDEEFKNQAKFIESLQKELNIANEMNVELKHNSVLILKEKEDLLEKCALTEKLLIDLQEIGIKNTVLQNENALLLKDKEAFEQLKANHVKNEESIISNLRKEIYSIQNKLYEEQNEKRYMEELIEKIKLELASVEEDRDDLFKQSLEAEKVKEEVTFLTMELENCQREIKALINEKESSLLECFSNLKLEKEISQSVKNDLKQTSQELFNLKKEKENLMQEYYQSLQAEGDICSKLEADISKIKDINVILESELQCVKKELKEKELQLEEISLNSHLENLCPYKKEINDIRIKNDDLTKLLHHERETFKLWKTNLEEDLHCKLLKISDLESTVKKETQCYKEAIMCNSELHQKLQESQEKFKRLEDKLTMQRDVYIKEKSKYEVDMQNKDKILKEFESKLHSVKYKCEEFSKDLGIFLQKLSNIFKEEVTDLSSAMILISNHYLEKQRLTEELKEIQEKAEQLEEECELLNGDIKYHENIIGNLFENGKMQEEKWKKEKEVLEKESLKNKEMGEKITAQEKYIFSLKMEMEEYKKSIKNYKDDRKALDLEKNELQGRIIDLEQSLQSFKNQEIDCIDGIKRELNLLKLELVNKNKAISKLEMRLESESLPFQKKAEMAERKVEELAKELQLLKRTQSLKQMSSALTSPIPGLEVSSNSHRIKEKTIEKLQENIKQLTTEKSALKLLAQNRRIQIKDLKQQLGKRDVNSFEDE